MNKIRIDNTRFIFKTNFAGDPRKSKFSSDNRTVAIVVPDENQARALMGDGINVGAYVDSRTEETIYFVNAQIKYKSEMDKNTRQPMVYLVPDRFSEPILQTEETIRNLDDITIANVKVILNPWINQRGTISLYVDVMYVEQGLAADPFAQDYYRNMERELPFDTE